MTQPRISATLPEGARFVVSHTGPLDPAEVAMLRRQMEIDPPLLIQLPSAPTREEIIGTIRGFDGWKVRKCRCSACRTDGAVAHGTVDMVGSLEALVSTIEALP